MDTMLRCDEPSMSNTSPRIGDPARTPKAVGRRLKEIRVALKLTQEQFAEPAGITQQAYANYESGSRLPSVKLASRLRDVYDLPLDYIYLGDTSMLPLTVTQALAANKRR